MRPIYLFMSLFLSACSSMVNVDYDKSVNFKNFDTYTIQLKPVRITNDTRINTPFMLQRIESAINNSLTRKGFFNATKKDSLVVKYYLEVKQEFETDDSGLSLGFGSYGHHSAIGFGFTVPLGETYSIDKLILTIDMVSTKTNQLVWRGSLAAQLEQGTTPESNSRMVNALVEEILQSFPPK